jgi:predicted  nucleic acid-binding Zn-ribbon protein
MDEKIRFLLTLQSYEQRLLKSNLQEQKSHHLHFQDEIKNLQEHFDQTRRDLLRDQQQVATLEYELCQTEENLRQCLGQQALTKKTETFQALGTKISQLREQISSHEDTILQHLEANETKKKALILLEKETQTKRIKLEAEMAKQCILCTEYEKAVIALQEKIRTFREDIVDRALLHRYDQVKARGVHFPWITPIEEHHCQGCHILLSPEQNIFFQKNPESQILCEQCGRLLYMPIPRMKGETELE